MGDFNAPLTQEEYNTFGMGTFNQDQIDQGIFTLEDFNPEWPFGMPDA